MAVRINSMVKLYTLLLLAEDSRHGYELMKLLSERLDRRISASQVYPFLSLLSRHGIVSAGPAGNREKKSYTLTKQGSVLVRNLLGRFGELAYRAIVPNLTTCAHCGCKVYGAHTQKIKGKELAFCCKYCAQSYTR
ncbi:PadR family transcriptional regulator [Candidatus Woesearchaeota archaeon]|nr:PadR family transcriptional regulator [Candidatus Woesearchaeota archaeon]